LLHGHVWIRSFLARESADPRAKEHSLVPGQLEIEAGRDSMFALAHALYLAASHSMRSIFVTIAARSSPSFTIAT
jgi:hypothetical protein